MLLNDMAHHMTHGGGVVDTDIDEFGIVGAVKYDSGELSLLDAVDDALSDRHIIDTVGHKDNTVEELEIGEIVHTVLAYIKYLTVEHTPICREVSHIHLIAPSKVVDTRDDIILIFLIETRNKYGNINCFSHSFLLFTEKYDTYM